MGDSAGVERLTGRQREILELVSKGLTNEEIGGVLGIAHATVRNHVTALFVALDVTNRTEAAARFIAAEARIERVSSVLERPAIAVLPLVALDDTPRARTLAGAIARDLATLFAASCWFPVIAQVSTANARMLGTTSSEIGAALGARFLVDGALLIGDGSWRIEIHIDDAHTGHVLWTARHEVPERGLLAHLDEVCAIIVAHAYPVLVRHAQADLRRIPRAVDLPAWELAHRGMDRCAIREPAANAEAQRDFEHALARDTTLVIAHYGRGLAAYDAVLNQWGDTEAAHERLLVASEACLELAPHAGEGYFLQGRRAQARGDHPGAVRPLEAAIAHNPSFAQAHALLAQVLQVSGRPDDAMARMRHAIRLGPRGFVAGLSTLHWMRGEYPEALATAEDAIAVSPRYTFARVLAAVSAHLIGERARAVEHLRRLRSDYPPFDPIAFRRAFGGEVDAAHRIGLTLEALAART